jgi:hypothetical protein
MHCAGGRACFSPEESSPVRIPDIQVHLNSKDVRAHLILFLKDEPGVAEYACAWGASPAGERPNNCSLPA